MRAKLSTKIIYFKRADIFKIKRRGRKASQRARTID